MPPSQTSPTSQDQDKHIRQQNELQCFARHCNFFYLTSLSLNAEASLKSKASKLQQSKAVLEAFDTASSHTNTNNNSKNLEVIKIVDQRNEKAILECGFMSDEPWRLFSDDPSLRMTYMKIRDEERSRAHQVQMLKRHEILVSFIEQGETELRNRGDYKINGIDGAKITKKATIRGLRGLIRKFVRRYEGDIGCHPFLAGLRELMERQLESDSVVQWNFDGAALSENLGKDGGKEYLKKAVGLMLELMIRVEVDVEDGILSNLEMRWEVIHCISDPNLNHVLALLPQKNSLEGRPTGTFRVTGGFRTNKKGELDERDFFDEWCTVL